MKKNGRFLLTVVVLFSLLIGCSQNKKYNYYRQISDNHWYHTLKGIYPVKDKDAQKVNCYHFIYNEIGKPVVIEYLKNGMPVLNPKDGYARIVIEYTKDSEKRMFQDAQGQPATDKYGISSIVIKSNEHGHPVALFNYDAHGRPAEDKDGIAQYLWTLDESGFGISTKYYNLKGERAAENGNIYEIKRKYNRNGYVSELSTYGQDGQLIENKQGIAIVRFNYNSYEQKTEETYFDKNGQPINSPTLGFATIRWKYDKFGNIVEISSYGTDGALRERKDKWGFAVFKWEYDDAGNAISTYCYGADGKPKECINKDIGSQINFFADYVMPADEIVAESGITYNGVTIKWKRIYHLTDKGMSEIQEGGFTNMPPASTLRESFWSLENGHLCYGSFTPLNDAGRAIESIRRGINDVEREECPILRNIFVGQEWEDDLYRYKAIGIEQIADNPVTITTKEKKEVLEKYEAFVIEHKMSQAEYNRWANKPDRTMTLDKLNNIFKGRYRRYYVKGIGYVGEKLMGDNGGLWADKVSVVRHNFYVDGKD